MFQEAMSSGGNLEQYINWNLIGTMKNSVVTLQIPQNYSELKFVVDTGDMIFERTLPKQNLISISNKALVFVGTSDTNNLFYAIITVNETSLKGNLQNARWQGKDKMTNSTVYVYAR